MTAGTDPTCTVLEWDSAFFGLRIGRVHADRLTPAEAARAVAWGQEHELDCLYALVEAQHTPSVRALEAQGFILADIRLTIDREIDDNQPAPEHPVREAEPADEEPLRALARVSHRNTRFAEDSRFDPSKSDELYAKWISNAFEDRDSLVLVPQLYKPGSGYLTMHFKDEREGEFGLAAVAEELRGRGLGEALFAEGMSRFRSRGVTRVSLVTQGRSTAVMRFYGKLGFKVRSCQFWYHRWFQR